MNKIKELIKNFNKNVFNKYNRELNIDLDKNNKTISNKNKIDFVDNKLNEIYDYSDKDNILDVYKKKQQNKIKGLYTGLLKAKDDDLGKNNDVLKYNLENESLTKEKIVKSLMLDDENKNKIILKLIIIFIFLILFMILLIFLKLLNFRNYIIFITCFVVISIICVYLIKIIKIDN